MTFRYEFGFGKETFATVHTANPPERIGQNGGMSCRDFGAAIEQDHGEQAAGSRIPGLERSRRLSTVTDAIDGRIGDVETAGTLEQCQADTAFPRRECAVCC